MVIGWCAASVFISRSVNNRNFCIFPHLLKANVCIILPSQIVPNYFACLLFGCFKLNQ